MAAIHSLGFDWSLTVPLTTAALAGAEEDINQPQIDVNPCQTAGWGCRVLHKMIHVAKMVFSMNAQTTGASLLNRCIMRFNTKVASNSQFLVFEFFKTAKFPRSCIFSMCTNSLNNRTIMESDTTVPMHSSATSAINGVVNCAPGTL